MHIDREVDDFPGVKLVAQPTRATGTEGEVLIEWPGELRKVGPINIDLPIPAPSAASGPRFARLFVDGDDAQGAVHIIHPPSRNETRL